MKRKYERKPEEASTDQSHIVCDSFVTVGLQTSKKVKKPRVKYNGHSSVAMRSIHDNSFINVLNENELL